MPYSRCWLFPGLAVAGMMVPGASLSHGPQAKDEKPAIVREAPRPPTCQEPGTHE